MPYTKKLSLHLLPAILILSAAGIATVSMAQAPIDDQSSIGPSDSVKRSPADIVDMLARKLALTDDQKNKILPIISDRQLKMQAARGDTGLRPRQKMRQIKGILSDSDAKINALLTPDQQQTYKQIEEQMRETLKSRRAQGAASP